MAGSGIERTSRPVPFRSPAGVSTLMPPHIQGAERRTERRARWGLRALVIGGLTGAAWLLTAVAAHAAEPVGSPWRSIVTHEHGGTTVDVTVPPEVVAPTRLTGGPADLQQRLATVPASDLRISSPSAANPVGDQPDETLPAVTSRGAVVRAFPVARANTPRAHQDFRAGRSIKHRRAAHRRPAVASATADGPVPDRRDTPGGDGPAAPMRPYLGEAGGSATTGPATLMEGGCAAFLPAAIADSTMACHPLRIATDVEARRHDAEAPTVSPD